MSDSPQPASAPGAPLAGAGAPPRISIVVPVFRNAGTLRGLHGRLVRALGADRQSRELIFVDDGCDAGSGDVLRELAQGDESIIVVELGANRGQHAAVFAGLERAQGEWTVLLDADLQDPPEAIPRLLAAARPGADAVFAGRRGSYESSPRLLTGRLYRRLLRRIAGTPADAGIFVALSRRTVERLLEMRALMPERPPQVVAMIGCAGVEVASVPVRRDQRLVGASSYTLTGRLRSAAQALAWATAWRLRRRSRRTGSRERVA